jgi:hypothetical protein
LLAIKVSDDDDCKSSSFFSPDSVHCTKTG